MTLCNVILTKTVYIINNYKGRVFLFGYIKAEKPELKIREYEAYKGIYCSLCRTLAKEYGVFAKFLLSYDFAFLGLVLLGTNKNCCGFCRRKCRFNPFKKCNMLCETPDELKFTAAASVVSAFYKLKDDLSDGSFFKTIPQRLLYPFFKHYASKASVRFSELTKKTKEFYSAQQSIEKNYNTGIDRSADPTAKMLEFMFSYFACNEKETRILKRMGYCIGKWVYLIDAYDDMEDDLKTGDFNCIINKYGINHYDDISADIRAEINETLNMCISEADAAFELLDFYNFGSIIRNIICLGLESVRCETEKRTSKRKATVIRNE